MRNRCFWLVRIAFLFACFSSIPLLFSSSSQAGETKAKKILLLAGSSTFKPGEHEYYAGCFVLQKLLKQTENVDAEIAIDWPAKGFTGFNSVVFFFDGGEKHQILKGDRIVELQKAIDQGVGLTIFHQGIDVPKDFGERMRAWAGGAFENKFSQRAHWVAEFSKHPSHPIFRGVGTFEIDDGWLYKLRFVPDLKGVTPLLRTTSPKAKTPSEGSDDVVAFAYERPKSGRTFTFTGGHLHSSLAKESYRRFLTNGILWASGVDVPTTGAPVTLADADLKQNLKNPPAKKK